MNKSGSNLSDTIHDKSSKAQHSSVNMITDRRDPKFRDWITSKIKEIKSEHKLDVDLNDDAFVDNYLTNMDPNSSKQKILNMNLEKTLLGPGYYNVQHCADRNVPSFRFDFEGSNLMKEKNLAECMREAKQFDRDKAQRHYMEAKKKKKLRESMDLNYYSTKEALLHEMVIIKKHTG